MHTFAHSRFDSMARTKPSSDSRSLIMSRVPTACGSAPNSNASRTRKPLLRIGLDHASTRTCKRIGWGSCSLTWERKTSWSKYGICTIQLKRKLRSKYVIFLCLPRSRQSQQKSHLFLMTMVMCNHSHNSLRQKRKKRKAPLLPSKATSSSRIRQSSKSTMPWQILLDTKIRLIAKSSSNTLITSLSRKAGTGFAKKIHTTKEQQTGQRYLISPMSGGLKSATGSARCSTFSTCSTRKEIFFVLSD